MELILTWILKNSILFILMFIVYSLAKSRAKVTSRNERVVSYGWLMKALSIIGVMFSIGFYLYEMYGAGLLIDTEDIYAILITTTIFLILSTVMILETFNSKVFFDEEGIRKESVWTRDHVIRWQEIDKVSYREALNMVTIKSINGSKIRVIDYMNGFEHLMFEIKQHRLSEAVK